MGELKTITKIPVGAVALMGAVIYAILGLISGIISAIGIAIGVSAIQIALPATTMLGSGQASRLPLLSVAWFSASLAAIL